MVGVGSTICDVFFSFFSRPRNTFFIPDVNEVVVMEASWLFGCAVQLPHFRTDHGPLPSWVSDHISPTIGSRQLWVDDFPIFFRSVGFSWWERWLFPGGYDLPTSIFPFVGLVSCTWKVVRQPRHHCKRRHGLQEKRSHQKKPLLPPSTTRNDSPKWDCQSLMTKSKMGMMQYESQRVQEEYSSLEVLLSPSVLFVPWKKAVSKAKM